MEEKATMGAGGGGEDFENHLICPSKTPDEIMRLEKLVL